MIVETQIHSLAILLSLCESLHPSIIRQWCVGFPPMVLFPIGVLRFRFRHETFLFFLRNIYELVFSKSKRFRTRIWDPGETDSDCTEYRIQYRLWPDLTHSIYDEEEFRRWPLDFSEWVLVYLCSHKLTGDKEIQWLRCIVKNYEWGKLGPDSLVGRQVDRLIPQTELWMGTHESGPSHVEFGLGHNEDEKCLVTLKSWVLDYPNVLGFKVVDKRGCDLPLLVKVLSVKALPLQAQVFVDVILDLQRRVQFKPNCHYKSYNRLIVGCCRFSLVSFVQTVTLRWAVIDNRRGSGIWVDMVIFFVVMLKRITQVQYFKETLVRKCWCHYVYIQELALDTSALMLRFVKRSHSQRLLYSIRNKEESNMKLDNNRFFDRLASKATLRKASSNSLLLYFLLVYGTYICVCNNCISLILYIFVRTLLD